MFLTVTGALAGDMPRDVLRRSAIIGLIAFLTLIDLFGSQALLPRLVDLYQTDAATMGFAVNASTIGMALAGITVAWFSDRIDRRRGLWLSLAILAIPTFLLSITRDPTIFAVLRIAQGACMATAFTLTMTYLSERCDLTAAAGAMAAYITGNVAANLFGRLMAGAFADWVGVPGSFVAFACLNLIGAAVAYLYISPDMPHGPRPGESPLMAWRAHLSVPALRAAFGVGFLILFAFIGTFTYVNLELVGPRLGLDAAYLGVVYLVFAPALLTTPLAGRAVARWGPRPVYWAAAVISILGLVLLLVPSLPPVLLGLALMGAGTFFAQAAATGFVGRRAVSHHAAANGLYLTSYYMGGLLGALVLGQIYVRSGWPATVGLLIAAMALSCLLARRFDTPPPE
ncbi:MAG: MFS transporter [Pseudomonadota bacterium]